MTTPDPVADVLANAAVWAMRESLARLDEHDPEQAHALRTVLDVLAAEKARANAAEAEIKMVLAKLEPGFSKTKGASLDAAVDYVVRSGMLHIINAGLETRAEQSRADSAVAEADRLARAIRWVVQDMSFKAPEQVLDASVVWHRRLTAALAPTESA